MAEIDENSPGGLCALCENTVADWEEWTTMTANGFRYIVHQMCVEEMETSEGNHQ